MSRLEQLSLNGRKGKVNQFSKKLFVRELNSRLAIDPPFIEKFERDKELNPGPPVFGTVALISELLRHPRYILIHVDDQIFIFFFLTVRCSYAYPVSSAVICSTSLVLYSTIIISFWEIPPNTRGEEYACLEKRHVR